MPRTTLDTKKVKNDVSLGFVSLRDSVGIFVCKNQKVGYFGFMKSNEIDTFSKIRSISLH